MTPKQILKKYFGYDEFRPLQAEIIEHVMGGRDALVLMPTGGGKSLCFQVPALLLPGLTLVVSPLISLMKDQVDALVAAGVPAAFLNSTLAAGERARVMADAASGRLKILYLAPERLAASGDFLRSLRVSLLAVDEAHCISEWGHDFRPDYRQLAALRELYPRVPLLALTATATDAVRRDIARQLSLGGGRLFVASFNRPNLTYAVIPKRAAAATVINLVRERRDESVIVYCSSRQKTEGLAADLRAVGVMAEAYHAGLPSAERHAVQERFIRDDCRVVVATIAFGMGIDKPDVRLVIHHDLPKSVEGYYQETGRAGRDGLPSACVLLFSAGDRAKQMWFVNQMEELEERRHAIARLGQVMDFCTTQNCRRRFLLEYFGESCSIDNCDGCDVCRADLRVVVPIVAAKSAAGPENPDLFAALRSLRKQVADELGVPAFVVFGDRTLKEMSARRPRTREDLAGIFGVGARKLETFGDRFLAAVRDFVPPSEETPRAKRTPTVRVTREFWEAGLSVEAIAAERGLTVGTVLGHLEELVDGGVGLDLSRLVEAVPRLEEIREAFAETGGGRLAPVAERMGEGVSYDELRLARLILKSQGRWPPRS